VTWGPRCVRTGGGAGPGAASAGGAGPGSCGGAGRAVLQVRCSVRQGRTGHCTVHVLAFQSGPDCVELSTTPLMVLWWAMNVGFWYSGTVAT
jgi:hypothetical protein